MNMQQDKAIIKALEKASFSSLPPNFNERTMLRVYKEVEKKKKLNFIFMIGSLSAVSAGLIATAIYLMKQSLSLNFTINFQMSFFKIDLLSQYYFEIYIAALILVLIFFDYFLRNLWNKKNFDRTVRL